MRYLVISDIHSNRIALEAVLQDARGTYDQVLCLGDVVGYGAHPNECCEMLRDAGALGVLGNHDMMVLGWMSTAELRDTVVAAIEWTKERLSKENWVWLYHLKEQLDIGPAQSDGIVSTGSPFQAIHGSLQEPYYEEYILMDLDAQYSFEVMRYSLCLFGHTHRSGYFRTLHPFQLYSPIETVLLPEGGNVRLENGWKYLLNPGSCGQPRDGNPQARYTLLDAQSECVQIKAIDYDIQSARQALYATALPREFGDRLLEAW